MLATTTLDKAPSEVGKNEEHVATHETVDFQVVNPGDIVESAPIVDSTFNDGKLDLAGLGDFLQRPVVIASYEWLEGALLDVGITPWDAFFGHAAIKRKLENYAFVRCRLEINIQVNASPFYCGKAYVAYRPLTTHGLGTFSDGSNSDIVSISQQPHVLINPAECEGGKLVLPFFYGKNWLTIGDESEFVNMGLLQFRSPGLLRNANSVAGAGVHITVWANAVDVELSGATTNLALQSSQTVKAGRKPKKAAKPRSFGNSFQSVNSGFKDEYGKGVVSTVSSAAAAAVGKLSDLPVIGPFATATSMGLSSIASIANVFGYTNVPVIEDVRPVKNQPFHAFASPDISTPVEKLGVDPKNELTIDSRTVGLDGTDELTVQSIVTRESFLTAKTWTQSHAVGTILFSCAVSPKLWKTTTAGGWHTPMSHLSNLFDFWRGSVIVGLNAYKTKYHAGRLLITWDPVASTNLGVRPTEQFSFVWDIGMEDKFEVSVPYNQALPWLEMTTFGSSLQEGFKEDGTSATATEWSNGVLTVTVLNALTAPSASSEIDIAVTVAGGEDMQFACPANILATNNVYEPQSKELSTIGSLSSDVDGLSLVTMGEAVPTLRSLLRRTTRYTCLKGPDNATAQVVRTKWLYPRFPMLPGYDPFGQYQTSGAGNPRYNYTGQTPYTWVSPCFLGQRGSMNYALNVVSGQVLSEISIQRERELLSTTFRDHDTTPTGISDDDFTSDALQDVKTSGMPGLAMSNQRTQTGVVAQVPMYSNYRMLSTVGGGIGLAVDGSTRDAVSFNMISNPSFDVGENAEEIYIDVFYGVGTDFNLFFYINAPFIHLAAVPGGKA